ncbi:voltage gated chloride channel [Apiospora arundinis]
MPKPTGFQLQAITNLCPLPPPPKPLTTSYQLVSFEPVFYLPSSSCRSRLGLFITVVLCAYSFFLSFYFCWHLLCLFILISSIHTTMARNHPFKPKQFGFYLDFTPEMVYHRHRIAGFGDRDRYELMEMTAAQWNAVLPLVSNMWQLHKNGTDPPVNNPRRTVVYRCSFNRNWGEDKKSAAKRKRTDTSDGEEEEKEEDDGDDVDEDDAEPTRQRNKSSKKLHGCKSRLKATLLYRVDKGAVTSEILTHAGPEHIHTFEDYDVTKFNKGLIEGLTNYIVHGHHFNVAAARNFLIEDRQSQVYAKHIGLANPAQINRGTAHAWIRKHPDYEAYAAK